MFLSHGIYLLISFRKSIPAQNRQLNVLISKSKQEVDDFVGELTFTNQLMSTSCEIIWALLSAAPGAFLETVRLNNYGTHPVRCYGLQPQSLPDVRAKRRPAARFGRGDGERERVWV